MRISISILTILIVFVVIQPVFAGCARVPDNAVWGRVDNAAIATHVRKAMDGDWQAYVDKWQTRLDRAKELQSRRSIMIFHSQGLRLRGDALADYISDIEARLNVTKCLAGLPAGNGPSDHAVAGAVPKGGS